MPTDLDAPAEYGTDTIETVVDETLNEEELAKKGPLLDEKDDKKVAKRILKMWTRQDKAMGRRFAVWQRNKYWRQGYRFVNLDRSEDKWEAKVPLGMGSQPPLPNKCDRLCRRVTNTLLSDDPIPECEPSTDSSEDVDAAEFATRILKVEGSEAGFNMIGATKRASGKSATYASSFAYWYVDPTGGGKLPKQVSAHPDATEFQSPEQVVLHPETGLPAAEGEYVDKYVKPDSTLTANKGEADFSWLPKVQVDLLTGHNVRFLPEKVDGLANARGVLVLLPTTLGELKESYPESFGNDERGEPKLKDDDIRKIANWRPAGGKEALPDFVELQDKIDDKGKPQDDSIVFALHLFYVSHGEYPEGAHICIVDDLVLCRDTHTATIDMPDGTQEVEDLDLPLSQCRQLDDDNSDDPYGIALAEKLGPMDEIRAQVFGYAIDHLHRFANPHTFLPDGSIVQPKQLSRRNGEPIYVNPQGKPEVENVPNFDSSGVELRTEMGTEENDESSLQQAAQGVEDPSVDSGIHARTIVEEAQKGLSQVRTNLADFYVRSNRIVLQLMRIHYSTERKVKYVGEDGGYKEECWTGSDLRSTRDVRIARGSFTMMGTSAKRQMAIDEISTGVINQDDYRELMSSSLSPSLGLQDNPFLMKVKREVALWNKGPTPEFMQLAEQHASFEPVQAQAFETAVAVGADPAVAQMAGPPPLPSPFQRVPSDLEPAVARIRHRELARLQQTKKFERQPLPWQQLLISEYQQMRQAAGIALASEMMLPDPNEGTEKPPIATPTAA